MPNSHSGTVSPQCAAALKEYRARLASGERVHIETFVAAHPAIASELRTVLKKLAESSGSRSRKPRPRAPERETHSTGTLESQIGDQQPMPPTGQKQELSLPPDFGRYRVEKQLGRGAMGAVYLAHDTQLARDVALKTPSLDAKSGRQRIERFQREARAAARLNHEFICTVYDVGEIDGVNFIAMEFVDGKPLSDFVGEAWPERRAIMMVRRLALAMDHAHTADVVHRDLKPANVMIDRQKRPKIMDFGLARQVDADEDESRMTKEGAILGTPAYMSPEQVLGDLETGPPADIYALGIILFELLTGNLPFRGGTTIVLGQILGAETPRLSHANPNIDPELDAICARAMAKKPEDRFGSMKEFAQHLTDFLQGKTGNTSSSDSVPVMPPPEPPDPALASTMVPELNATHSPQLVTTDFAPPPPPPPVETSSPTGRSSLFTVDAAPTRPNQAKKPYSNAGLITISVGFLSLVGLLIGGAVFLAQTPADPGESVAKAETDDTPSKKKTTDKNEEKTKPKQNATQTSAADSNENEETETSVAVNDAPDLTPVQQPTPTRFAPGNTGSSQPRPASQSSMRPRTGNGGFGGGGGGGFFGPRNRTPPADPQVDDTPDPDPDPKPTPKVAQDPAEEKLAARERLQSVQERRNFDDWYKRFEQVYKEAPGGPYGGTYTLGLPRLVTVQKEGLAAAAEFMAKQMPFKGSTGRYNVYYQFPDQ